MIMKFSRQVRRPIIAGWNFLATAAGRADNDHRRRGPPIRGGDHRMGRTLTRRDFVVRGAAAGVAAAAAGPAAGQAPQVVTGRSVKPVVISAANGNRFKNGGPVTCVEK